MRNLATLPFAAMLAAACPSAAAQYGSAFSEAWFMAKFGQPSPGEQALQRAEAVNSAFRQDTVIQPELAFWEEQRYQAKFGRSTPAEELRRDATLASTAYRQDLTPSDPNELWKDYFRAKFGRDLNPR